MNTIVTSREAILQTSRELIQKQGWSAVSIRRVAEACHISVGSIYNYFDGKSALMAATVESIWSDVFHMPETLDGFQGMADCVTWLFEQMRRGEEKYPGFFTMHAMSFIGEDKTGGQQLMEKTWCHIRHALHTVLRQDPQISPAVFDEDFTSQQLVDIVFSLMLAALIRHDYDSAGVVGMLQHLLYS